MSAFDHREKSLESTHIHSGMLSNKPIGFTDGITTACRSEESPFSAALYNSHATGARPPIGGQHPPAGGERTECPPPPARARATNGTTPAPYGRTRSPRFPAPSPSANVPRPIPRWSGRKCRASPRGTRREYRAPPRREGAGGGPRPHSGVRDGAEAGGSVAPRRGRGAPTLRRAEGGGPGCRPPPTVRRDVGQRCPAGGPKTLLWRLSAFLARRPSISSFIGVNGDEIRQPRGRGARTGVRPRAAGCSAMRRVRWAYQPGP